MLSKYVYKIILLILLAFFCRQCYLSLKKYYERKTTFSMKEVRREEQQYPSVTICPSLPLKKKDGVKNIPMSPEAIEVLIKREHKTINDTFYFVNHPSKSNPGFPCMTTKNSFDPGKPCHFPFSIPQDPANAEYNKTNYVCVQSPTSNERFCATKVSKGNLTLLEKEYHEDSYGFCPPRCKGETMYPDSEFNLAKVK